MISHIFIKNFAIIERIDIDLHPGLNVVTGETGAGKSIIIEAVSLALGSRADTAMVRNGRDKALIRLVIDEDGAPPNERSGIELLGREISSAGKSVCRIDDEIVTLSRLSAATKRIADIHGQYDHQSLLDPDNHIITVDAYGAADIEPAKERVRAAHERYVEAKRRLDELLASEATAKRESDLLRYEVREIDAAAPVSGEYEELTERIKVMQNGEKIFECLAEAHEALAGEHPSAVSGVGHALNALRRIAAFSDAYRDMADILSECSYSLDEVCERVRNDKEGMDFSPRALDDAIARLDTLDRLIAKYGGKPGGASGDRMARVLSYRDRAREKLSDIDNIDDMKAERSADLSRAEGVLTADSGTLSGLRKRAAAELEAGVNEQLRELNFQDAVFRVKTEAIGFSANGADRLEFFLSANKGQPPLPIAKAASGGEMSRVMLALKSVVGDCDRIPTMIFDEIDSGISGVTASIVGEKLLRMARDRQIVCITHLPQIAAFADHHFVIKKSSDDKTTYTTIDEIVGDDKVVEIARLLGGKNVTPNTLKSAKELIELSRKR
ncbi:MAG: DNA repair protein RecN [Clostridiales Family XIII bacterium]|jgi:DNA repair protein RecN (Recombination protein N)|nr:DNA repair protein RecN [Clostridiales Family XIII bacterium]